MLRYSDTVLSVLKKSGWTPDRDIYSELKFPSEKRLFRASKEIFSSLGLLKLDYFGSAGAETIYFDVDDSSVSKGMRKNIFGYDSVEEIDLENEPDFEEIENFKWTNIAESYIGPCSRIGFLDDDFGFDIYVDEKGHIYLAHGEVPELRFMDYLDFLNATILSTKDRNENET